MSKLHSRLPVLSLVAILGPMLSLGGAEAAGSPGTAFTYQGLLKDGSGNPVTATCDIQFGLYDALNGGNSQGATPQTVPNVTVTDGYFTVSLDFGANAFDGNARWLDISVRCPAASGSFTPLGPRQALAATPYALYAVNAGAAASFSDPLAGDVIGPQGSTTVTKLQGQPVTTTAPAAG